MTAPEIHTERLILRPHTSADFPAYEALMASERARYMGGPFDRRGAWGNFCHDVACWSLFGHGALAVELDGKMIGQVSVSAGPLYPERELGWCVFDAHEGQGYMTEAAAALRDWTQARFAGRLVSYVDPENVRSIALAERLGAVRDPDAHGPDPGDLVFLYPQPEEGA